MGKTSKRDKAAADRAEARSRGEAIEAEALPDLPEGDGEGPRAVAWDDPRHPRGVEYHPSGRPVVRYGPAPSYPQGEAELTLLARIIELGAQGYSFNAIALQIGHPPSTLRSWAKQPYGAKLREVLAQADEYARGAMELQARRSVGSKEFNAALWGKLMASRYEEYRSVNVPLAPGDDAGGGSVGLTDFEFERRMLAAIERIKARRDAEAATLPAPSPREEGKQDE